jgi:hypothetical protein
MEVNIYFEGKDDLKLSIEVLENLYSIAKDEWDEACIYPNNGEEIVNCNANCDVLQHLIITFKNKLKN